jgi:mannosidase alpha-like ER degradation enhancer 2
MINSFFFICLINSYSLTLIDSLDMLILLGNKTEFERVSQLVLTNLKFDKDINVSVFETNIRSD